MVDCEEGEDSSPNFQSLGWNLYNDLQHPTEPDEKLVRFSKAGNTNGFTSYITITTPYINGEYHKAFVVVLTNKEKYPLEGANSLLQEMIDNTQ